MFYFFLLVLFRLGVVRVKDYFFFSKLSIFSGFNMKFLNKKVLFLYVKKWGFIVSV